MGFKVVNDTVGKDGRAIRHAVGIKADGGVMRAIDIAVGGDACTEGHYDRGHTLGDPCVILRAEGEGLGSRIVIVAADLFYPRLHLFRQLDVVEYGGHAVG